MDSNDTIALNARWNLTLSESYDRDEDKYMVTPQSVAQFVSFLEAKIKVTVPFWWTTILAQRYSGVTADYFGRSAVVAIGNAPDIVLAEQRNGILSAISDAGTIRLETFKPMQDFTVDLRRQAMAFANDKARLFVCRFSEMPIEYPIGCFRRDSGALVWQSVVWVGAADGSGYNAHGIQLVSANDRLFVFGAGKTHYVQELAKTDGKTTVWWTTELVLNVNDDSK